MANHPVAEIKYSKRFAYFATSAMLILGGVFLFFSLREASATMKLTDQLFLIAVDLFPFLVTFYLLKKFLLPAIRRKSAIVLDQEYLTDNIRHTQIRWKNINKIRMTSAKGAALIAVDLKNNAEVTSQTKNIFKKLLYLNNRLFFGTPVLIPTQYLEGSNQEILTLISGFLSSHR